MRKAGLVYTGLIPARDEDQVCVGFVYAQLTNGARKTLELEGSHGVGAEMFSNSPTRPFSRRGYMCSPMHSLSSTLAAPRI